MARSAAASPLITQSPALKFQKEELTLRRLPLTWNSKVLTPRDCSKRCSGRVRGSCPLSQTVKKEVNIFLHFDEMLGPENSNGAISAFIASTCCSGSVVSLRRNFQRLLHDDGIAPSACCGHICLELLSADLRRGCLVDHSILPQGRRGYHGQRSPAASHKVISARRLQESAPEMPRSRYHEDDCCRCGRRDQANGRRSRH